jgi:stage IV sporulation protein FB
MFLGEPPRTPYDLNFAIFGIPIRVHPLFWFIALVLGMNRKEPISVLIWIAAVFVAILVHELGHAAAMRAYGFFPWITLYGMGGLTSHDRGFSSSAKGLQPLGQSLISLAGPGAGFALAALLVLAVKVAGSAGYDVIIFLSRLGPYVLLPNAKLANFINSTLFICVVWGAVNLLPIYPLDGGQIAREIFLKISPRGGIQQSLSLSMVAAIFIAVAGLVLAKDLFIALLFGYLAFANYATLQSYNGRNPW